MSAPNPPSRAADHKPIIVITSVIAVLIKSALVMPNLLKSSNSICLAVVKFVIYEANASAGKTNALLPEQLFALVIRRVSTAYLTVSNMICAICLSTGTRTDTCIYLPIGDTTN